MKKIFAITLIIFAAVFIRFPVSAQEIPIDILINGKFIKTSSEPILENGVTYAPLRPVAEALNADEIFWNDTLKCAYIKDDETSVTIYINSRYAYINGEKTKMSAKAFISNDRTYIPVRFISEIFGADVNWNQTYKNVEITKNGITVPAELSDNSYTQDEIYWMSRIINAESGGEVFDGQVAVGDVILNRVSSPAFPDTIYGVIFDKQFSVQFEPVLNGTIYNTPCERSVAAAKISMKNPSTVGKSLYFYNPSIAESTWIPNNRVYYKTIGNHVFYL